MKTNNRQYWQDIFSPWVVFYKGLAPFAVLVALCLVFITPAEQSGSAKPQSDTPPITIKKEVDQSTVAYESNYCTFPGKYSNEETVGLIELDPAETLLFTRYRSGRAVQLLEICAKPYLGFISEDNYITS